MSTIEKHNFKTFLEACYQEKIMIELGSVEAQLIIAEFKSNLRKHILNGGREEYCQVYDTSSVASNIIVSYLRYNEVSFNVQSIYGACGTCTITVNIGE